MEIFLQVNFAPSELPHLRCEKCDVVRKVSLFLSLKGRGAASTATWPQPEHGATNATNRRMGVQNQPLKTKYCTFWFHLFFSQYPHPKLWRDVFDLNFLSFLWPHSPWSELWGRSALKAFLGGKSPKPWNHDSLRLRTVKRNDFSWTSQEYYRDIEWF